MSTEYVLCLFVEEVIVGFVGAEGLVSDVVIQLVSAFHEAVQHLFCTYRRCLSLVSACPIASYSGVQQDGL